MLQLLSQGKPNKLIGRSLGISEGTVKIHLAAIFRALNVQQPLRRWSRRRSADRSLSLSPLRAGRLLGNLQLQVRPPSMRNG